MYTINHSYNSTSEDLKYILSDIADEGLDIHEKLL